MNDTATHGQHCDVFVIGGGPAGTTIATLLAKRGFDVVLAEKDTHPRFHIGESLLPLNLELFKELGVLEQIREIGLCKPGVEFNSPVHEQPVTLNFSEAWDKTYPYAYQVRRSDFDKILFDHCTRNAVRAMQACHVTGVSFPTDDNVLITTACEDGKKQWQAGYLVDASGRDTFLGNRLSIKRRNRQHTSAALYGHFEGAKRLHGEAQGNISIFWFEHGWFWFIPLQDGTTSIGAVCPPTYLRTRSTDPASFLQQTIDLCPALKARLKNAHPVTEVTATGNYSYECAQMMGDRYLMIGDAYAFVDPVFSSGVYLAMRSAFLGADVVETSLRNPARAAQAQRRYRKAIAHGLNHFSWFIYRMTEPAMRHLFMAPRNIFRVREALLSLLAGDLYGKTPIYPSLFAFKMLYYATCALQPRSSIRAWQARRQVRSGASP
ncbi:MAG: NAD(P)/FAD-dependent oxidoreductase [Burkholderiales bacterium]|jgi:2-polyprenyl-6-methoxyphenol hydroxylase-like FAD-dependent oxidoreductase